MVQMQQVRHPSEPFSQCMLSCVHLVYPVVALAMTHLSLRSDGAVACKTLQMPTLPWQMSFPVSCPDTDSRSMQAASAAVCLHCACSSYDSAVACMQPSGCSQLSVLRHAYLLTPDAFLRVQASSCSLPADPCKSLAQPSQLALALRCHREGISAA